MSKPKKTTLVQAKLHRVLIRGKLHYILDGIVKNHPKLQDGYITTSVVKHIDFEKGIAQTKNTTFHIKWRTKEL